MDFDFSEGKIVLVLSYRTIRSFHHFSLLVYMFHVNLISTIVLNLIDI